MRVLLTCLAAVFVALGWVCGICAFLGILVGKSFAHGYRQAVTRGAA